MPARYILSILVAVLSAPFILTSRIAFFWGGAELISDLKKCSEAITAAHPAPDLYIKLLIMAEDHRNALHPGVDPIAVLRCCLILITRKKNQGGSTIEQQLVRVVLNRYERTIRRKLREQIIAVELSRHFKKNQIASAYLSMAFYGTGQYGLEAACDAQEKSIHSTDVSRALLIISKLKYPEPLVPSEPWTNRVNNRVRHIRQKMADF
jgi:penicillin-binding protein 1A